MIVGTNSLIRIVFRVPYLKRRKVKLYDHLIVRLSIYQDFLFRVRVKESRSNIYIYSPKFAILWSCKKIKPLSLCTKKAINSGKNVHILTASRESKLKLHLLLTWNNLASNIIINHKYKKNFQNNTIKSNYILKFVIKS